MKPLFIAGVLSVTIIAGSMATGIVVYNSCGYNEKTGNYIYDHNKVSAYGTMDAALECALMGMLPDIVSDRLGRFGYEEEAEHIKSIDAKTKQKIKEKN